MILWQKRATSSWLTTNEEALARLSRRQLAIITLPGRKHAIAQVVCSTQKQAAKLLEQFGGSCKTGVRNWRPNRGDCRPIQIGRYLQIVRSFQPRTGNSQQLLIPFAGAFGTGEHATTAMSLRLLAETAKRLPQGWRLLDAGTGTGILALAARQLGAELALGIDIDRRAIAHARRNAKLNRITGVSFSVADILRWRCRRPHNIITANLYSELLIAALPQLRSWLQADGCLVASGILRNQKQSVVRAITAQGFQLLQLRQRGKWVALLGRLGRTA
jgi:ribosomal protein L11 methyltransferase